MRRLALLLAALLCWALPLHAQDVLPVPALSARVIDQTGTLSEPQRAALESRLAAFEAEAGPQIVVLMVATTQPEDIAAYAQRVADSWKIGRREVGDGLLLLVAKNDRKVRIEVAKALEGAVPDLAARQIIDRAITPAFRAGDYAGGLAAAVDQLIARVKGEALPLPKAQRGATAHGSGSLEQVGIFFFVIIAVVGGVLSKVLGRKFGSVATALAAGGLAWWMTASLLLAAGAGLVSLLFVGIFGVEGVLRLLAASSMARRGGGGGWGGGGGGGGFRSGGGGDFGGGGASGRW